MKLSLVRVPEPAAVAAPLSRPSFTSSWETAVRRWLWGASSSHTTSLDEVAQEVFIRFSGYSDATLMRCPQTFVLKVASNVVDEWCGTPRNEWLDEEEGNGQSGVEAKRNAKEKTVDKALAKQLQNAVDKLPSRQRQILLMHVNEGLTYRQIGEKLKMTPGIVRKDLVKAYSAMSLRDRA